MNGSTMDAALTGLRRAGREASEAKDTLTLVKNLDLDPKTREEVGDLITALVKTRGQIEIALEDMKSRASETGAA